MGWGFIAVGVLLSSFRADVNRDGRVSVQDVFDYLAFYHSQDSRADFNQDGSITLQDVFGYLNVFYSEIGLDSCRDGLDNDQDGLIDSPFDPDCLVTQSESGQSFRRLNSYAVKHGVNAGTNQVSYRLESPVSFDPNVLYPWVLYWEQEDSMDAQRAKRYIDQLPLKAMFSWTLEFSQPGHMFFHPEDDCRLPSGERGSSPCPWMNAYLQTVRPRVEQFMRAYRDVGGELDVFTMDLEALGEFTEAPREKRLLIQNDPRFIQRNPLFDRSHFLFGSMQEKLGALDLNFGWGSCGGQPCQHLWGHFVHDWTMQYVNEAVDQPIRRYFPNAHVSNFNGFYYDFRNFVMPIFSALTDCASGVYCGGQPQFGNGQQPGLMYGLDVPGSGFWAPDGRRRLEKTDFNVLKSQVGWLKVSALSNPESLLAPLFAGSGQTADAIQDIYSEAVFHALLSGSIYLNFWQNHFDVSEHEKLGRAIREFDQIAGFENRQSLMFKDSRWINGMRRGNAKAWYDDFILTGMRVAGRKVWRLSVEAFPGDSWEQPRTVAESLMQKEPLVFQTRQVRIEFPEGKIWRPATSVSSDGFWIVQPETAASPIIEENLSNLPPRAQFQVFQVDQLDRYVLFDASASFDPDGDIVYYDWDFNGDGVFGDFVFVGDGGVVSCENLNAHGVASWFHYLYNRSPEPVSLRVRDNQGAVSEARVPAWVFSQPRCSGCLLGVSSPMAQ